MLPASGHHTGVRAQASLRETSTAAWSDQVCSLVGGFWFVYLVGFWVFFLVGLGFELRASGLQSRLSSTSVAPPVHFALVILEMRSHKLLAQAGLEL
jgi:hypothetical protein